MISIVKDSIRGIKSDPKVGARGSVQHGADVTIAIPLDLVGTHFGVNRGDLLPEVSGNLLVKVAVNRATKTSDNSVSFFVGFPQVWFAKSRNYVDIVQPITSEARAAVESLVLEAVEKKFNIKLEAIAGTTSAHSDELETSFAASA